MIGTRLNAGSIALYTAATTLTGVGGASVAAWADADGDLPEDAFLQWTNNGLSDLEVGDATTPVQLLCNGVVADVLFGGREVVISPGESIWTAVPRNAAALGTAWSIRAPLVSAGAISVTVVARKVDTSAPKAKEVLQTALTGNAPAGSLGEAMLLIKGLVNGNVVHDQYTYDAAGRLTGCRIRVFPTGADAIAGSNVLQTFTVVATNGGNGPTNYRVSQN